MVNGMKPLPQSQTCLDCVYGKFREQPYNKPMRRGEYPLEFVYLNTAGPFAVARINRERYFTTISCNKTILTKVYPY